MSAAKGDLRGLGGRGLVLALAAWKNRFAGVRGRFAGLVRDGRDPGCGLRTANGAEKAETLKSETLKTESLKTENSGGGAAAGGRMRLSAAICTANIAEAADGDWVPIAPYGQHPSPDGSYTQVFTREQAEKVVATWNSITGTAARLFKNMWHGLGAKSTCPVWDGHPETDKVRWPKAKCLAEITELRTGNDGLEGRLRWTGNARPRGPLFPSPLWWHWPPAGEPPAVFPELLESVGLVPTPNISSVPAWTQNAAPDLASQSEAEPKNTTSNIMEKARLIALLGLAADATDEQIETALRAAGTTANALQTANTAKADLETQLTTANAELTKAQASVTTLTTERDNLQTANAGLTAEKDVLVKGVLDLAEKRGAITPAEREAFQTKVATANTAEATLAELQTRKAMNTEAVVINGNRVDLSTANARREALLAAITQRMEADKCDHATAFARCQKDPALAGLFAAMQDPTRKG